MRKSIILLFNILILELNLLAQGPTSFYFGEPQPSNINNITNFDNDICGKYVLKTDSLTQMYIVKDSIYIQQNILFILTKKDFKKSKGKYYTENNLLFGIVNNKGLQYVVQNDTTFAIYKQIDRYFVPNPNNILRKQNNIYYLNEKTEQGHYTTSLIYPIKKGIAIYSLDHELVMKDIRNFNKLDSLNIDNLKTYIAYPKPKGINKFVQNRGFRDVVYFVYPKYYEE